MNGILGRTGHLALVVWLFSATLVMAAPPAKAEDGDRPAVTRRDELLTRWAGRDPSRTLDVTFTIEDSSDGVGRMEPFQGRWVVGTSRRFLYETRRLNARTAESDHRIVGTGTSIYEYRGGGPSARIFPYPGDRVERPEDRGHSLGFLERALHAILRPTYYDVHHVDRLPFLFDLKLDEAKRSYEITLLKEDDAVAIFQFKSLTDSGKGFRSALLILDKERLVLQAVHLSDRSTGMRKVYRFTRIARNAEVDERAFETKPVEGKTLEAGDSRGGSEAPERGIPPE